MRRTLLVIPVALALLVALPAGAANASTKLAATVVTCGQKILVSTRLANDLHNCKGTGLVIGADHVTLDLAGHTVDGVNAAGSDGIAVDGHVGATVKNGSVRDFYVSGVALRNAPHALLTDLRITHIGAGGGEDQASAGVLLQSSGDSAVTHSFVSNNVNAYQSDGIDVLSSPRTLIAGNHVVRNSWYGMFVDESPHSRILDNVFGQNPNQGVEVNAGSDWTRVSGNRAWGNAANGIVAGAVSHLLVSDNVATGNGENGLFFFDLHHSAVRGNRASGNGGGIELNGGQFGSSDNSVVGNVTNHNLSVGLVLADGANDNSVVGNTASWNQGQPGEGGGVLVIGSTGNLLAKNVADGNLDVGVAVFEEQPGDSAGNALKGNVANGNGAHGMDVVAGTKDLGGNRAHGNKPKPNCLGVSCS
jgi:nitrous oxidase accessory protein NosD